ncbi:MAG: triose-phosphate isomerase [Deltaproteobacteria bacterium]|nr:triose-phosphate isomerase [Deltaproteobacteria bacterium]MBW2052160.1 triose-phosphate isomerase [Deltaproteobacteria bacterium]MBW2139668.1 triose-phosphate isomerase [Deltaproteobacteria bacterium]MBW2322280.1 triose-phosphate isomerase [Deltaproteobacteria bacterium]
MSASPPNRRPLIAGNWKMYKTGAEAAAYIEQLKLLLPSNLEADVALAPSFTALESALMAAGDSPILIAAQNVFWEDEGAYTGEVSVPMLNGLGVEWVIIGHSERRQYFGETDETVNRRVIAALAGGLNPIVCIGETLEQREANQTFQVLTAQLKEGLAEVDNRAAQSLTIAYEPIWAIGTGRTATTEIAQEAHRVIRDELERIFNKELANYIRILYGGSVKPENAAALLAQPDIDGALVGGASLKPDVFYGIINF